MRLVDPCLPASCSRARTARLVVSGVLSFLVACTAVPPATLQSPPEPPCRYECHRAATAPLLDGRLDDAAWAAAAWTSDFVDIQGPALPAPRFRTRAKMLWDDQYLYLAAEMEEPELWAEYTQHDQVVFHQHDFEVFIDPDGDGREYYELEVNVLGTIFDLYLHRAYRDGGPAVHEWDAVGLRTAIATTGTVNDPRDRDAGWTLEWAVPWSALQPPERPAPGGGTFREAARDSARGGARPAPGSTWRLNFSRVEWRLVVKDDPAAPAGRRYAKVEGAPEDNWVWSPQWAIDMHRPEHWGFVTFQP